MILCASGLRLVSGLGETQGVARLAADTGFDGLAVGAECPSGHVTAVVGAALSAGLAVPVMAAPLAEGPLDGGRRLPFLAALDDPDERRAAVSLFGSMLELAVPLGIRHLTVYLGDVPLGAQMPQVAYRFARRELLDEDEPGAPLWAAAVGERRALSGAVMDACRHALDRILPQAERRDVALSIEVAGGPWSAPTPREAMNLLQEYGSAPLGVVWDEGRMQVLSTLGIAPAPERAATLAARATIWRVDEAVGMRAGYLPGLGDPPSSSTSPDDEPPEEGGAAAPTLAAPAPGIPVIVTGYPDSTAGEVETARLRTADVRSAAAKAAAARSAAERLGPEERR